MKPIDLDIRVRIIDNNDPNNDLVTACCENKEYNIQAACFGSTVQDALDGIGLCLRTQINHWKKQHGD